MAINALIAQGVRPVGEDIPQILANQQRNALATRSLDANIAQDQTRNSQYERQLGMQEQGQKNALAQQNEQKLKDWASVAIDHVRRDPSAIPRFVAEGKQMGFIPPTAPDTFTPEDVEGIAMRLGIAPAAPKWQDQPGPRGSLVQFNPQTGERRQVVGPDNSQPTGGAQERYVPLTPAEIEQAGLPPGTSAQKSLLTGKVDVLSKRDSTASLSQKDQMVSRQKLNTVSLARQQLQNIKQKFAAIKGTTSAGAFGQGRLPTEKGQMFDAAVNQMRSTLTALTRVPGVGAMSDYETKLDQSKFPDRKNYEAVTADQLEQLDSMLNAIETGYTDLLGGSGQRPGASGNWAAPAAPAAGGWKVTPVP